MNEQLKEKIGAKFYEDTEFAKAFVACENAGALQKVLADNGFEVSVEEIEELFRTGAQNIVENMNDELNEDDLDEVAGGGFLKGTARLIVSCAAAYGYGAACAVCPPLYAGANYVAGGLAVWTAAGYMK